MGRARLHLRVAEAIEDVHEADRRGVLAELARHFAAAESLGGTDKAVYYGRRAGAQAMRSAAYDQAISHLDTAIALSKPRSAERIELLLDRGLGPAQRRALPREHGDVRSGVRGRSFAQIRPNWLRKPPSVSNRPCTCRACRAGLQSRWCWRPWRCSTRTTSGPGLASSHRWPVRTPTPGDRTTHSRRWRPLWRRLAKSMTQTRSALRWRQP